MLDEIMSLQTQLFDHFEEFFVRATGKTADDFSTFGNFDTQIKVTAEAIGKRGEDAFRWLGSTLPEFYAEHGPAMFQHAAKLGGLKAVLGGGSRFLESQFNGVRKLALYADTVLIPDPVYPWLESERRFERFHRVHLLKAVFGVLHLKPLVHADLPYPAVLIFPSWEKTLEERDSKTQQGIWNLVVGMLSYHLGIAFTDFDEVMGFAESRSKQFLDAVESARLFIAPGGNPGQPIQHAIRDYRDDVRIWRTAETVQMFDESDDATVALLGVVERLSPQYHLVENAYELEAQPLLTLPQHWHYYKLTSQLMTSAFEEHSVVSPSSVAALNALSNERFSWLGNVPIDALANLRRDCANEDFRQRLSDALSHLRESQLDDLDAVAAEFSRELAQMLRAHDKEAAALADKYGRKHAETATSAWLSFSATFLPLLGPIVASAAPFALATKYGWNKYDELREQKLLAHSLLGILATARDTTEKR